MKRILAIGVIVTLVIAYALWRFPTGEPRATQEGDESGEMVTLVENLDTPWAIAFLPNGAMIFTERSGRVSVLDGQRLRLVGEIDVHQESESGLHGIAIDPDFEENPYVYLYYTHQDGNRVSRFTLAETLTDESVLLDGIPNARFHDGGRIKFGPDGKLYVTTGDATEPSTAQDPDSLAGKILRMNPDGTVPEDNPFGNHVYSLGHRNPQGLAWDGEGILYASEHGLTSHDEINAIERGANYGWPRTCGDDMEARDPIRCYTEFTLAPAGIAWLDGSLYVAGLRGTQLRRLTVQDGIVMEEEVVLSDLGRMRDVVAHGGYLYVATSNRDGRGLPAPNDDRILRLEIGNEENFEEKTEISEINPRISSEYVSDELTFEFDGSYANGQDSIQSANRASGEELTESEEDDCIKLGCPIGTSAVGSKNSDKWHYCYCRYASQIYPENLVCFSSIDEAEDRGYVETKRC